MIGVVLSFHAKAPSSSLIPLQAVYHEPMSSQEGWPSGVPPALVDSNPDVFALHPWRALREISGTILTLPPFAVEIKPST